MILLMTTLALLPQEEDFAELLRRYREAFEGVTVESVDAREIAATEAASRFNSSTSRDALWRAISDPRLSPDLRMAAIDALRRKGEDATKLLDSLFQIRKEEGEVLPKSARLEARLLRHSEEPRVAIEDLPDEPRWKSRSPAKTTSSKKSDEKRRRRNTTFLSLAGALAIVLLLLRKRNAA